MDRIDAIQKLFKNHLGEKLVNVWHQEGDMDLQEHSEKHDRIVLQFEKLPEVVICLTEYGDGDCKIDFMEYE